MRLGSSSRPRNRKSRPCNLITNHKKKNSLFFLCPQRMTEGEELITGMHLEIYEFFLPFFSYGEREREGDLEILVTVPKGEAREGEGRWIKLERLEADEGKIRGR